MNSTFLKILFALMAVLALGVGGYAISNFFIDPPLFGGKGALASDPTWVLMFNMHIGGGAVALIIGWLQFIKKFRSKRITLHRRIGIIYIISILLVGAVGGGYLAWFAMGGFANQLGFMCLNILWFYTTLMAFITIKKSKVEAHKNWMTYSYALTFAAVTLRVFWPLWEFGMGIPNEEAYAAIAWFCWVPNIIFAQFLINKKLIQ